MKKCLIVEDQEESRLWIEELVREVFPELEIIHAASLAAAHAALDATVEMALVDLGLPDGSGVELISHMRENLPRIAVSVVTVFDDDVHLFDALCAGAQGYLLKSQPNAQVVAQLRAMKEGVLSMAPSIARRVLARLNAPQGRQPAPTASLPGLTEREQEVLQCIVRGKTVKELAAHLGIAPSTAAGYVRNIYGKLEVSSRAEAVAKAMRSGLHD